MRLTKDTLIEGEIVRKGTKLKVLHESVPSTKELGMLEEIIDYYRDGMEDEIEGDLLNFHDTLDKEMLSNFSEYQMNYYEELNNFYFNNSPLKALPEDSYEEDITIEYLSELSERNKDEVLNNIYDYIYYMGGRYAYINTEKLEKDLNDLKSKEKEEQAIIDSTYNEVVGKLEDEMLDIQKKLKSQGVEIDFSINDTGDSIYLEVFNEDSNEVTKIRFSNHERLSSNYNEPDQNINIFSYVGNTKYDYLIDKSDGRHPSMDLEDDFDIQDMLDDLDIDVDI